MLLKTPRPDYLADLRDALQNNPIVSLLGPRQSGKTTLSRDYLAQHDGPTHIFDLEDPRSLARLAEPMLALEKLEGLVVIDEIQLQPNLYPILRVLADRPKAPCTFLILGSASPEIIKGVSESLAGRIHFIDVSGLGLNEVGRDQQTKLWRRGGFPRAYHAADDEQAFKWLEDFILTFLQRDIPQLGIRIPSEQLRRFWVMLAHYHANTWNASEISRSLGLTNKTIRHYADILAGAYMVRLLPPWFENTGKRLVKSPKAYIRDSGLLHALLGLKTDAAITSHPKLGASWEGFAIETIIQTHKAQHDSYFWATQSGAELDLLIIRGGKRYGFEFKYADAPRKTKSMGIALEDLKLDILYVVHPGSDRYPIAPKIEAIPLSGTTSLSLSSKDRGEIEDC